MMREVSSLTLTVGGNIVRQGEHFLLGYQPKDVEGNPVNLEGKTLSVAFVKRNQVVYETTAEFDPGDGLLYAHVDQNIGSGEMWLEFTATDPNAPTYRKKFPSSRERAIINVVPGADDIDFVGVGGTTVEQLRTEQATAQQEFEAVIVPKVESIETQQLQLSSDFQAAAGALTEDSEVILARGDKPTLGARLDETAVKLADIVVNVKTFGAKGDGVTDDTASLRSAFASGAKNIYFPKGVYKISIDGTTHRRHLAHFLDKSDISITGKDATILDVTAYSLDKLCNIFMFTRSKNIKIHGINYKGIEIVDSEKENRLGNLGATFAYFEDHCENIDVDVYGENLRYGVRSGDYMNPVYGECKGITANVRGKFIGYPISLSLAEVKNLYSEVDGFHRSIYLAGVKGAGVGKVVSNSKNQYGAVIHVLLTNAVTTYSTVQSEQRARGCSNLEVHSTDSGSTKFLPQSAVLGIGLQWVAQGTAFENLTLKFAVKSNNTIASAVGGFILESSVTDVPYKWEPYISLKNIKVSGAVIREAQTAASNSLGEIYIRAYDQVDTIFDHCPTVSKFTIEDVLIIKSGSQLRNLFIEIPNLLDSLDIKDLTAEGINMTLTVPKGKVSMDNVVASTIGSITNIASMVVKNSVISELPFALIQKLVSENSRLNQVELSNQVRRLVVECNGALSYTIPGALKRGNLVKSIIGFKSSYVSSGTWEIGIPGTPNYFGSASLSTSSGLNRFSPLNYAAGALPRYFNPASDLVITFKPTDPTVTPSGNMFIYITEEIFTAY